MVAGLVEDTVQYLNNRDGKEASKQWTALYKTGTTPLMTFFYNEPWNNASTGPAPFLTEPEVHMSCLRTIPEAGEESRAPKVEGSFYGPATRALIFFTLLVALL